ncbi:MULTISPECIES: restriction endonuclease subunit S [unclassified Endozoicomonas]|uniref:restriction endonuclease subunit S n=1 Tax=unclassified Endozoicomonas TaxID=2644528 RepID=UPI003BB6E03C
MGGNSLERKKYAVYPEYKDSGVEWLGKIPTTWDMWKLNHAYDEIGSGTTPPSSSDEWYGGDIPWVTTGELREAEILDTTKKITEDTIKRFPTLRKYPKGSVAIAMYGATIGRLGIFGVEATTNQACCVLTESKVTNNKYLYYWLQAFRQDIVNLASGGGQPNINQEVVASLKISSPDKLGQQIIVSFLNHETAKIDTLIEEQQSLIRLLKEKRQAVISHAVTKGLNPDAPMKDSGAEWLGEVPEHWVHNTKLMHIAEETRGSFVNGPFGSDLLSSELKLKGVPVIYIRDVKPTGYFRKSKDCVTPKKAVQLSVCSVSSGDVLVSKVGSPPGDACVYPSDQPDAIITQDVVRIRVDKCKVLPEYLCYLLNADYGRAVVDNISVESTRKRFSLGDFKQLKFPLPCIKEQASIIANLLKQTSLIDQLIGEAISLSEFFAERRTALISAAVTGKIDVRDWVAPS